MKSYISRVFAPLLGLALLAAGLTFAPLRPASVASAQVTPTPAAQSFPRTISVSGSGSTQAAPDIAIIDLGVTTEATTAREALSENNDQMDALITTLRGARIANADIRTTSIQLYPRYDNPPVQQSGETTNKLIGYTATNIVQVTVRNLDNLGQVLDQAVSAGSNTVQGIRFDLSDPSGALDEAREAAMRDAMHKAEQLATLTKTRLGVVVSVSEASSRPLPFMVEAGAARDTAGSVPVSPGTQTITVDLQVVWEIQ